MIKVYVWQYLLLGFTAFVLVGALTPYARRFAISHEIYDLPNAEHKSHAEPTPYLGGVAIIVGILGVSYAALFAKEFSATNLALQTSVLGPALLLGLVGLWDDIKNLRPLPRLLVQSTVGVGTAILLIETHTVGVPTGHPWIDGLITLVWIVGICNSINFFDNLKFGARLLGLPRRSILCCGAGGRYRRSDHWILALEQKPSTYLYGRCGSTLSGRFARHLNDSFPPSCGGEVDFFLNQDFATRSSDSGYISIGYFQIAPSHLTLSGWPGPSLSSTGARRAYSQSGSYCPLADDRCFCSRRRGNSLSL